ncbi:Protein of unknown function [Anaerocolumna jejuensis DSM 15929]|uniref:DUF1569 domain-containing protein n=1 Tax=Anaerocolumna jejuensis DSM 15929 TaxID=1121322 RepID=A0A1M7A5T3_9FIRM|nr:DUF1569 domain-containing protein [Anaerocolumna jejuensis]SHL37999.1 Protein of unknown function [Anaerocolumna jejuensis DSM 15929]
MKVKINSSSLEDAEENLLRLKNSRDVKCPNWNVSEICQHCAQSINYSMTGYPQLKPALIRATVGRAAIHKFLRQGYMKHDLTAPVPGGSKLDASRNSEESVDELLSTIEKFRSYSGQLLPHLLFGKLSKDEYDSYFAMHIADHLNELIF